MLIDSLEAHAGRGAAPLSQLFRQATGSDTTTEVSPDRHAGFISRSDLEALCSHYLGASFADGHDIRPLKNGRDIFPAMLACIEAAVESIELVTFIFEDSDIAERFAQALIARADAGVSVRLLLDDIGSGGIDKKQLKALENSAVELAFYNPVPGWKFWRYPTRNHRKILVVDGRVAFTGGVGIAEEWTGDADSPEHYREAQFRITGPAVAQLRGAFFNDWASTGAALPESLRPCAKRPWSPGSVRAAVVPSVSASKKSRAAWLLQLLTRCANQSIEFATPYFVPGKTLENEIVLAAERGIDIKLMVSGRNTDHALPLWAGRASYKRLLRAGVRIVEYDPTLMHCKLAIVDRSLVCFGSVNMNQRSQSQDEEIAVLAQDQALAERLLEDMEEDYQHSQEIELDNWCRRRWHLRLKEWLALKLAAHL